ncbi:MAG: helix-turn-helix domain-containing protein [Fusobacterium sp.]|uniref:helix-turn-helix domain-containing protein n=1 Tax=Fusobacterium sp. TaxID=68766 RepID=UPI00399542CE
MNIEKEKNKLINSVVKARRKSGLTQTQLEEKSGIKQPVIARIEKGISCPNIDTLLKLLNPMGKKLEVVDKNKKMSQIEREIEKRKKEVEIANILSRVDGSGEPEEIVKKWIQEYIDLELTYEELMEKVVTHIKSGN